jgi:hypothetical protein
MSSEQRTKPLILHRRDLALGALILGAATVLKPNSVAAQSQGLVEKLEKYLRGVLADLKEDVREEVAKLLGMEAWVYGIVAQRHL